MVEHSPQRLPSEEKATTTTAVAKKKKKKVFAEKFSVENSSRISELGLRGSGAGRRCK